MYQNAKVQDTVQKTTHRIKHQIMKQVTAFYYFFSYSLMKVNNQGNKAIFPNFWFICTNTVKQDRFTNT